MFIVFEGLDGAGKSTQLQLCRDWLVDGGHSVTTCRDPGSTQLGDQVRDLLLHRESLRIDVVSEMFLFMTARAQLVQEIIRPALESRNIVLCDRFTLSTAVYQGHAGELEPETIWRIAQTAMDGAEPDLTLVFDIPVETALDRIGPRRDRMESRGESYLQKVRDGFLVEAERDERICIVDAQADAAVVFEKTRAMIEPLLIGSA